ncbi:Gfo/Idh/MocA family protein [Shewanella sp. KT0246]|uniref:Gfo/Idh/MocA family protein n=1 Tax=Shewanella sp. KT0246 TaxID=2815912 RepID=UPI001BC05F63|nr:Gfo/Idh/MocA family oxidoreductase [Shewanella sp. KT0246]GIU52914.1 dehydrogenase [Shewanella sp. KT0246]
MKTLNWGIIGAGRIAHQFASDMAVVSNCNFYAVAARDKKRAVEFAEQYDAKVAYGDYESLYNDDKIDVVYIATPHNFHFEQAKAAMLAGKSVLCEKPITVSVEESHLLFEIAEQQQVYLIEGMWTYFLPAIIQAKKWLKAGRIGTLLQVKADFGYPLVYAPDSREYSTVLAGGCVFDMGIYPIALAHLFTEQSPESIYVSSHLAPNGVEDEANFIFNYSEMTAVLGTSFRSKLQNSAYIIGDKGYITIPDFWRASECHLYELDDHKDSFADCRSTIGFSYEIEAIANDILVGKLVSDIVTPEMSRLFQQHIAWVKTYI